MKPNDPDIIFNLSPRSSLCNSNSNIQSAENSPINKKHDHSTPNTNHMIIHLSPQLEEEKKENLSKSLNNEREEFFEQVANIENVDESTESIINNIYMEDVSVPTHKSHRITETLYRGKYPERTKVKCVLKAHKYGVRKASEITGVPGATIRLWDKDKNLREKYSDMNKTLLCGNYPRPRITPKKKKMKTKNKGLCNSLGKREKMEILLKKPKPIISLDIAGDVSQEAMTALQTIARLDKYFVINYYFE